MSFRIYKKKGGAEFPEVVDQDVKLGFYQGSEVFNVTVAPRKNSHAICSGCKKAAPGYDRLAERRFEFVPLWGIRVFLLYRMRRVECKTCGVKVEQVPWADGKKELTKVYMQFLANWARKLSWKEVACIFNTSWEKVFHAVEYVVEWGKAHRPLDNIKAIGVDEVAYQTGHKYLTVVYQIDRDNTRLLWVGQERTEATIRSFFSFFGAQRSQQLKYVCSDMWQPYVKAIAEYASQALHILDRFHIVAMLNKAIDEVRASEHKQLQAAGYEPVLKKTRWCLLKRKENLTEKEEIKLMNYTSHAFYLLGVLYAIRTLSGLY